MNNTDRLRSHESPTARKHESTKARKHEREATICGKNAEGMMHRFVRAIALMMAMAVHTSAWSSESRSLVALQETGQLDPKKAPILQEVDPVDPPSDVASFVHESDAVVDVQIFASRTVVGAGGYVVTLHTVRLLQSFKGHPLLVAPGQTLTIVQRAGEATSGGRTIIVPDRKVFAVGHEYALFLFWNSALGSFEVKNGYHGAFELEEDGVRTESHSQVAETLKGMNRTTFMNTLRRVGGTR